MSTALAIAGVTAVLRDLLNDGLVNRNISGTVSTSVSVSVLAPDRVVLEGGTEASQLNLFLYAVTPNLGWRNHDLPARDASGARLANPPLALDLHYLLSAYSGGDLHAEILLGYAMQLLHETPVLTREAIRTALNPSPLVAPDLPPALRALADAGLAEQLEQIKLTPQYQSSEESSKLWTATQSPLRPSMAYLATVVLIQSQRPARTPLPVLTRGRVTATGREAGIAVQPSLEPDVPLLAAVRPPLGQPLAGIGDAVALHGTRLEGTGRSVLLVNDRFDIALERPVLPPQLPDRPATTVATFSLAGQQDALPAGPYRATLRLTRPDALGVDRALQSNPILFTLAPQINNLPQTVARAGDGSATVTIAFTPALRQGQQARLVLGAHEVAPLAAGATPTSLQFRIADASVGVHLVRLRIDGIDSPIVDMDYEPPALPSFLNRTVEFT